ncbi:MAG: hypothetical protein ACC645_01660 [Pirellulales bacterium]
MSDDGRDEYRWRETYFILFSTSARPTLTQVERVLGELSSRVELDRLAADNDGRFESVTLEAPDDYAALEISYESGEAVVEQAVELAKQLQGEAEPGQLAQLIKADARLDVMHFERVMGSEYADDESEEMLDPSCLLMVVEALVALTDGVAIDPAAGAILN